MKICNLKKLIILDYSTSKVHKYLVDSSVETIEEEYIGKLGYNLDNIVWMFGDTEFIEHKGILM